MDKMMKAMKKCVEEYVEQLSVKYKFDKAEALEYIMPAGETVRGRPTKQKKKVVNKTEMVEDVIKTLMEEGGNPLSNPVLNAEAVAVAAPAVAEPVTEPVAVIEAAPVKEKKKPAPKKKKAEAEVAVAAPAVAVAAVTETVAEVKADAPVTEPVAVVEAAPLTEKKKAAPKKKADAARKVAAGKPEEVPAPVVEAPKAVVEAPKPVVEAPKPAPETKAAAPSGGLKGVSPLAVSPLEEDDDEGTAVKEWTHNSRSYLKSCENNCEEDDCNCSGVVYDAETNDQIGTWNGKTLAMSSTEDDEEADD